MMKKIRQLHLYLGVLFAPAIIFFSLTGALQTFGLHEGKGGRGEPSPIIAKMAQVHKNQTLVMRDVPPPGERPPGGASRPAESRPAERGEEQEPSGLSPLPLKIYVLLMSLGLITTTILGIVMAFKYNRDRRVIWGLLIAGTLLPLLLLYL